jgi:Flp pilus assembly protein TadG
MTLPSRRSMAEARARLAAHLRGSADGITLAIFAIALVVLLGFVALGVDGARGFDERREAQNAADHAAIAAAYASCISLSTDPAELVAAAVEAGENSAAENGYDDNETTNDVEIDVAEGAAGAGDHKYTATIETTIDTTFARVIGFGDIDTRGEATAEATGCDETVGGGAVPALFGGGNCSGYEKDIDFSGERHIINGLTHTNGSFYQGGSDNTFTNPGGPAVTYVEDFEGKKGDDNDYTGEEEELDVAEDWPDGFDPGVMSDATWWNKWRDSPHRVNTGSNTQTTINITADGIYYTQASAGNEVKVNGFDHDDRFTVVSVNAPIRFEDDQGSKQLYAFPNNPAGTPANTLAISGYNPPTHEKCAKMAFLRSANRGIWNGVFWAPRANIEWSGNESVINGGLVGYAVKFNGNDHIINGGTGTGAAQTPFVQITN